MKNSSELRYGFGKNWALFLQALSDDRIKEAERSLQDMLGVSSLKGLRFLDIGSGSGLFSLAAHRLGARVYSFDYDPHSVACTRSLKQCYNPEGSDWIIEEGSILDAQYIQTLGTFDVVYAWGVLHHTGHMWDALKNSCCLVAPNGLFFVAIYNDQGFYSKVWRRLKQLYCSNLLGRALTCSLGFPYFFLVCLKEDLFRLKNPLLRYSEYKKNRGMSVLTDWLDWFGGYPFEVAKPEEVFDYCSKQGFNLQRLKTCGGGLANNEFVFKRQGGVESEFPRASCGQDLGLKE